MSPAATAPDEPILAIYPVPGEIDPGTEKIAPLAPIPTRLAREDAEKAVKRGAFSFTDPSLKEREAAAAAGAPAAAAGDAKLDKAGAKAVADAQAAAEAATKRADALEERLAALEKAATPATT